MISADHVNRTRLYWIFQLLGWSSFFLIFSLITASLAGFQWQVFAGHFNTVITGFLMTHFYRLYIKKHEWVKLGIFKLAMRVLLASLLIAMIWAAIILPINTIFFPVETDKKEEITLLIVVVVVMNLSIIMLGWSLIYFLFQLFINFKKSEVEKWKLEAAVKDAELIALKSQVNPHFIFNSLNNIRSLVTENPEKARDMITHLSGLLRYSIQFNNMERVSLEHELEIVQNYLNLESIQFEDRLRYKLEIKPETLELKIPPMAVQLLVENAIKHGIANLPEGGLINIRSYLEENTLTVEVINTGQIVQCEDSTGIGLQNASNRLKLLFGKLSDLKIENMDSNYVSAKFTIPLN